MMDISQIAEYLYIASRVQEEHLEDLLRLDPGLIISMIFERRPPKALTEEGLEVLWLRTVDFLLIPIPLRTLNRGVEAALPVIQDGGRVLVFCQGGRHRSVAMASCILIGQGYSADEAMQLVSGKREVADPWAWHIQRQIRRFEAYWLQKQIRRNEMNKRIHVVINPAAGQPEPIVHILNDAFRPAGVKWDVSITHEYGDATRQAREAAEGGADIVVAYGGDGTVMEVVNGLVGTEVPLGILPGGTGNVLSVELDIPQTSAEAAQLLVSEEGQIRRVDVGQCGDNHFLLRAFVGFDAQRIQLATREMRDHYGKAAYVIAGLKAIPESKVVRYTLTLDGEQVECEGFTCIVENAGSLGVRGRSLAPNISVSDGLLDVIVVHGLDPKSLASAVASIVDKPLDPESFHHWQAKEITIATDPPQAVIGDGEAWGDTPITVSVLPQAVRVIAPGHGSQ